jgi:putative peptide zinc metalloprotease protein
VTTLDGPAPGSLHEPRAEPQAEVLTRAEGVQLIGEMAGSGYRVPPSLVRRGDGQTLQLSRLLYQVLEAVDGRRTTDEVAATVSAACGRTVSAENVRELARSKLLPLGLLTRSDGSQPEVKRSSPLLALRLRWAVTDPETTRRLTQPFIGLFRPWAAVPVVVAFGIVCWWVFFEKGLASATYQAFQHPGLLLIVVAVTVLSAGFHECGHAAAARYGGARPGVMGAGLYLVWPAFYTDVTDSYRLGRAGRVRTDLGGLYFNAIVAVGITGIWLLTRDDALLLVVATQILQMLRQLTPLVRFDGYHILADVTGVPDLFQRIKPVLLGILPWRWRDAEARALKPWARAVVTLWVLLVVPLLLLTVAVLVLTAPRVLATAWAKLEAEQSVFAAAWHDAAFTRVAAIAVTMIAVSLPVLASTNLLVRVLRRVSRWTWRATSGSMVKRILALVAAAALVAGLAWAWWPGGSTYRPIRPDERLTLVDAITGRAATTAPRTTTTLSTGAALDTGSQSSFVAPWDSSTPRPTKAQPQLALVLVPRGDATGSTGWVFPFDKPLAPGPGDNQSLAVNTEDGTIVYDVAIALVWVENGDAVLNTNEAYAFASCRDCAAVSVAFQVVLVVGDSDTVVPQNLSGALNDDCVNCLTYALAQQLLVTLDGPLSESAMAELDALWQQIGAFAADIQSVPLSEIDDQLDSFAAQILAIIEADQPGTVPSATSSSDTATPSPGTTTTGTDPTTAGTTTPAPSDSSGAPATAEATPSPEAPAPTESSATDSPTSTTTP